MCLHTNEREDQSELMLSSQKMEQLLSRCPSPFRTNLFHQCLGRQNHVGTLPSAPAECICQPDPTASAIAMTCLTVFLAQDGTRCARIISQDVPELFPSFHFLYASSFGILFPTKMPPLVSGNSRAGTRAGGEGARTGRSGAAASPEEVSEPNLLSFGHDFKI